MSGLTQRRRSSSVHPNIFALPVLLLLLLLPGLAAAAEPEPPAPQTLCILDFTRLGDDASADWLQRGLADMMIGTMNRLGPYAVIERAHLRALLQEHGLAASGVVDAATAVRQARLAGAQLLLLGSFARQPPGLLLQVRLLRLADQQVLARATWSGELAEVMSAPQVLSQDLLVRLGQPVDATLLPGIERHIPATIDVAQAYYRGVEAFDNGRYAEALAQYLDAARPAGRFLKAADAVIEMYGLLGQHAHAVLYARTLAQAHTAAGDIPSALAYYFAAARQCLEPLQHYDLAIALLQTLLRLVEQQDRQTGEIAATQQFVLDRIDALHATERYASFGQMLAHRSIRYRMWPGDIEAELRRRAEEQARGGYMAFEDGRWLKRSVPPPSLFMWHTYARLTLARAYVRQGRIEAALDQYAALLEAYRFLTRQPLYDGRLRDAIRTEAHFMMLYHYAASGHLVRHHALNVVNRLNMVEDGLVFRREFPDPGPDARARVASRYADRGYEYFDFAAPPGQQIVAVTMRAQVEGIAVFSWNVPHAVGWPPQFSLSRRLDQARLTRRGTYERTVTLPAGTAFVSIGTSWGSGLFDNTPADIMHHRQFGPEDGADIVWWQASFAVSPGADGQAPRPSGAAVVRGTPLPRLIERYADGWEHAVVVRQPQMNVYTGTPALDVYAEDWLVYTLDGDLRIVQRSNPQLTIDLPHTINTREAEFDASLVRTHDGGYALLWARGASPTSAGRFVAFSADLQRWQTPQRLVFEAPPERLGYTYTRVEPLERTYNITAVRQGYMMLLAQGFVRYSDDLRHWSRPHRVLPQQLYRNRLVKTPDGTLWAVYENASDTRQPYTQDDWLHGSFVVDGKRYRHVTEIGVSRSPDGVHWQDAGRVVLPGQPGGLWAFPVSAGQLGIAAVFNNLSVTWLTASLSGGLRHIEAASGTIRQGREVACFVQDSVLVCMRPVFDDATQQSALLVTSSRTLYQQLLE